MQLHERLEAHRERLAKRRDSGEVTKGSFMFWYCCISLALQILRLWSGK